MGGRGGSSGLSGMGGKKMSISSFLENLKKNSREGMLDAIRKSKLDIGRTEFTRNGNALKSQEAILESGSEKVSIRFYNSYDPIQTTKPSHPVRQSIEVVHYKNGNVDSIRKLDEKKSSSLKNAEKNYREMLEKWKKLTNQKTIRFK